MQTLRTADEHFTGLPEFPYTPRYCEVSDQDGGTLRLAWVEDGPADADPVLMLHGEPSWSFLYRRMIPILAAAGQRVICPDLVGFGRNRFFVRRSALPLGFADTAALLARWIESSFTEPVHVVGNSMGGQTAIHLASNETPSMTAAATTEALILFLPRF